MLLLQTSEERQTNIHYGREGHRETLCGIDRLKVSMDRVTYARGAMCSQCEDIFKDELAAMKHTEDANPFADEHDELWDLWNCFRNSIPHDELTELIIKGLTFDELEKIADERHKHTHHN